MRPRHVEIQVFADGHGNIVHLGERDCSVQRRHQKVIEEAPCPAMTPELRERMGAAAVAAARASVITAPAPSSSCSTRRRVLFPRDEHPPAGRASGHRDGHRARSGGAADSQSPRASRWDLRRRTCGLEGHAIEVRLYAEDPAAISCPHRPHRAVAAGGGEGVRVDAGIVQGQQVTPFYDPMLAKIIAWGETRDCRASSVHWSRQRLFGPRSNRDFL